ncbi:hypothetical protein [Streptomyces sp. NPDC051000]|uniref:hypothetical protein n=1 Tax=Streptomyces sp. NPDC051000 TaxID=3155520 RepID=UPI0033ECE762
MSTIPPAAKVIPKQSKLRMVRIQGGALRDWAVRRPLPGVEQAVSLRHSSDTRQMIIILCAMEAVLAFLVSRMVPPVLRPAHALLEVSIVLIGFGAVAAMHRHPHLLTSERITLRTGFLGAVEIPVHAISSVGRGMRTVTGRGLRFTADEGDAVACSVGASVNMYMEFDRPLRLDLGKPGVVVAKKIYFAADDPDAAMRAIRAVVKP